MAIPPNHVKVGDSSAIWCTGLRMDTVMGYVHGYMDLPKLADDLDIVHNDISHHATTIERSHACILAARIALLNGNVQKLECGAECVYSDVVAVSMQSQSISVENS